MIVEDNVLGKGAQTNGKLMVYGCGSIKEKFMTNGIKFNSEEIFLHANHRGKQKVYWRQKNQKKSQTKEKMWPKNWIRYKIQKLVLSVLSVDYCSHPAKT